MATTAEQGGGAGGSEPWGHFGPYGGRFVSETLIAPLEELAEAYAQASDDPGFRAQLDRELRDFVGRPTPLYLAERLTDAVGGARIYLKREDLAHTGAHKINNTVGQVVLARRMGKRRIIAETGAGQHGVATATVAARMGLACVIYMGADDVQRQAANVFRMRLLGAEVRSVDSGSRTLKDAMNEAMRDWVAHVDDTFYILGTVAGPHPYPTLVRDFQRTIGVETRQQFQEVEGRLPEAIVACVGGGSNALGIFYPFLEDSGVQLYGVEAGGEGLETGRHAAPLNAGRPGVLHGARSYLMASEEGQILGTHSVSAGLDYPGVGPEHAWLRDSERVRYTAVPDAEAVAAFHRLGRTEGILPALETAHALAYAERAAARLGPGAAIVVSLSGRGDKDIATVAAQVGIEL